MNMQMWLEKRAYDSGNQFTAQNTEQMSFGDTDLNDNTSEVSSDFGEDIIDNQGDWFKRGILLWVMTGGNQTVLDRVMFL